MSYFSFGGMSNLGLTDEALSRRLFKFRSIVVIVVLGSSLVALWAAAAVVINHGLCCKLN